MLRIATRRSPLARWQAGHVADLLRAREPGLVIEMHEVVTRGDRVLEVPLAQVGGKGLFVKEIEDALIAGTAQVAVHSMKDLPAEISPGLTVGAVPAREDPRDALVAPRAGSFAALPRGARVGTASLRRAAQLRALRPDLKIEVVRGNVETRLRKAAEELDGVVLARAGLLRLGLADRVTHLFTEEEMLPAVAQGALAIEARADDAATLDRLAPLDDAVTRVQVEAERGFLVRIQGSCQIPVAAHASIAGGTVRLRALVASIDGTRIVRGERSGPTGAARAVGEAVAEELLSHGADALVREAVGHAAPLSAPDRE